MSAYFFAYRITFDSLSKQHWGAIYCARVRMGDHWNLQECLRGRKILRPYILLISNELRALNRYLKTQPH